MTYSIIGSGAVGLALARHFARSGIEVGIANTRGPESIAALVKDLGNQVRPLPLQEALNADVLILAVPFRAHADIAATRADWAGKTVIDAMNTDGISPEELGKRASSDVVASAFAGAKVVKTLNQLAAKMLARDPGDNGGRRVMFVSSNDSGAEASAAKLVADLGFAPVRLGTVDQGGRLIAFGGNGTGGPLVLQNFVKHD